MGNSFQTFMTLFLTNCIGPDDIHKAKGAGIAAANLYSTGV
jgi:dihydroorotase